MADLIRAMGAPIGPPVKDKLGSPSTESEDGGGDIAELAAELELDEADGPSTNGNNLNIFLLQFLPFLKSYGSLMIKVSVKPCWPRRRLNGTTAV